MEGQEEMRKLFWSGTIVALLFSLTILVQASEDSASRKETKIPDEFALTITGRVIWPDAKPIPDMGIMLSETDPEKVAFTLRFGAGGKIINPSGTTDKNGRFTIVADRRYWEKTGYFTLYGGSSPLVGSLNEPIIIKVDAKAKKIDLGDIIKPYPKF